MEFFIKKGATLPKINFEIIKDGKNDYQNNEFNSGSTVFFSMKDEDTDEYKILNEKVEISGNSLSFQFKNKHTKKKGRFIGDFLVKTDEGVSNMDLKEKLYINIIESIDNNTHSDLDSNSSISRTNCCNSGKRLHYEDICNPSTFSVDFACDITDINSNYLTDDTTGDQIAPLIVLIHSDDYDLMSDPNFMSSFNGDVFEIGDIVEIVSAPGTYGFGPFNVKLISKPDAIVVKFGNNYGSTDDILNLFLSPGVYVKNDDGLYYSKCISYNVINNPDHITSTISIINPYSGITGGKTKIEYTEDNNIWINSGIYQNEYIASGITLSFTVFSKQVRITYFYKGICECPPIFFPLNPLEIDLFLPGTDPESKFGALGPQFGILWRSYKGQEFTEIGMDGNRLNRSSILVGNVEAGEYDGQNTSPVNWWRGGSQNRCSFPQYNISFFGDRSQLGMLDPSQGTFYYPWIGAYDRIGLRDDKEYVVFSGEQISHITSLDKGIVVACSQIEENALLAITDTYYGGYSLTVSKNLMTNPPSTLSQIVKVEKPSVDPAIQIRSAMLFEKDVFVIVLTDNKIWKTIDGGTSWNSVMQLDGDTNIGNMDSIVMDNNVAFIWIVGYSLGNLLKTIDAGSTWTVILGPNPQESSPAIFNAFDRNHIVIGKHYSNNGGVTWKIMNTPDDVTPFRSIVLNPDIIMIVLDKLWISLDGGDTFKLYNVQPTEEMAKRTSLMVGGNNSKYPGLIGGIYPTI